MKKTFSFTLSLLMCFFLSQQNLTAQGLVFDKGLTWNQIKTKANREGKYIFLFWHDAANPESEKMRNELLQDKTLGDSLNPKYICVVANKANASASAGGIINSAQHLQHLARLLNISHYPAIVHFNAAGEPLIRIVGYRSVDRVLAGYQFAMDPDKQVYPRVKLFDEGKRTQPFVNDLISTARLTGDSLLAARITRDYLKTFNVNTVNTEEDLGFVVQHAGINSKVFKEIFFNQPQLYNRLDSATIDRNLRAGLYNYYLKPMIAEGVYKDVIPDTTTVQRQLLLFGSQGRREWLRLFALYNYLLFNKTKNPDIMNKFVQIKTVLRNEFPADYDQEGAMTVNNDAWFVFENSNDPNHLATALQWSHYAIRKEPNEPNWLDTYANLLYKIGRTGEAIKRQEEAVELSNGWAEFKNNLEKMKRGEKTWPH